MQESEMAPETRQTQGFSPEVQAAVDLMLEAAKEATVCFTSGNKAAGRRARVALGELKKSITPLRQTILDKMKGAGD